MKWYEEKGLDNDIILSSRVRLARNLKNFPFPNLLDDKKAKELIEKVKGAIKNDRTYLSDKFNYIDMSNLSDTQKLSMIENHIISPNLALKKEKCACLLQDDESISIMVNEEDHLRIQVIYGGDNIDKAYDTADKIDDLLEESLEYAFDNEFGYLTSCVTNTGTALRASYMLHLPMLEKTGKLRAIAQNISKFGMTLRGIYGEGSEPLGSIYQISNQVTLALSEKEIISSLKNITNQVILSEKALRDEAMKNHKISYEDMLLRSYGILKYCKKISSQEAMKYLSDVLFAKQMGLIKLDNLQTNIYNIMMKIQRGNLQMTYSENSDENNRDIKRAEFINNSI